MNTGRSAKPPKTPDPNVVSQAQTQSNQDTAAYNAALNRSNVYTPLGSQTFNYTGKDPTTGAPMYDQHVDLSPDAQALLDQQLSQNRQLGDVSGGMLDQISSNYSSPMDTSGVPKLNDAPAMGSYRSTIDRSGAPQLQGSLDMSDLPQLYGADDLNGARQQTQDAIYNKSASYLDPQWQQREDQFRTRMNNQGVVEGSEAYDKAYDAENRARSFDYGNARNDAITGGGAEMQRLSDISRANRGQTFGERQAGGQFTNNARAQAIAEEMGLADFQNSATGAGNADALRAAGFGNQAREQGLNELYRERQQPLTEFNQLRQASPVELPQFDSPPPVSTSPTNVADNMWRAYQGDMDLYNADQAGSNQMFGGLANLGGQLGSAWISRSDARLKKNITPAGKLASGINVYDYEIDGHPERGVIAQEVEKTQPDAVHTGRDGYKRVNYSKVLARAMAA